MSNPQSNGVYSDTRPHLAYLGLCFFFFFFHSYILPDFSFCILVSLLLGAYIVHVGREVFICFVYCLLKRERVDGLER